MSAAKLIECVAAKTEAVRAHSARDGLIHEVARSGARFPTASGAAGNSAGSATPS